MENPILYLVLGFSTPWSIIVATRGPGKRESESWPRSGRLYQRAPMWFCLCICRHRIVFDGWQTPYPRRIHRCRCSSGEAAFLKRHRSPSPRTSPPRRQTLRGACLSPNLTLLFYSSSQNSYCWSKAIPSSWATCTSLSSLKFPSSNLTDTLALQKVAQKLGKFCVFSKWRADTIRWKPNTKLLFFAEKTKKHEKNCFYWIMCSLPFGWSQAVFIFKKSFKKRKTRFQPDVCPLLMRKTTDHFVIS